MKNEPRSPAPRRTLRQRIGDEGEARARALLEQAGLRYVDGPIRFKVGELDLVFRDGSSVVFVEVRVRRSTRFGGAGASVDHRKQLRVQRAAQAWLQLRYGSREWPACRFDVVLQDAARMEWVRNAFEANR